MKNRDDLPRKVSTPPRLDQDDLATLLLLFVPATKFRGSGRLQDQHAIAVTVEAIPVTDRFLVRTKNKFASCKRAHQHQ